MSKSTNSHAVSNQNRLFYFDLLRNKQRITVRLNPNNSKAYWTSNPKSTDSRWIELEWAELNKEEHTNIVNLITRNKIKPIDLNKINGLDGIVLERVC